MSTSDIVTNIDQRLVDLDAELTHLSKARTALVSEPTATAQSKPRARRAPVKRTFDVVASGKLIALLADSDGMRTRELSDTTNADPSQVLALLKEHEAMGQVRRTGTRAATRWHAITDEDRIAARAAELEGASGRRSRARKS